MDTSDLAKRMKDYERRNRYYLQRRMPVLIRLDMRSGHSFTKGFKRPFDEIFMKTMQETAKYLCENIQNCKLAYVQSDEITLLLIDYEKLNTDVFFDYRVDKLCSIAASMATMAFNKIFSFYTEQHFAETYDDDDFAEYNKILSNAMCKGAMFDARVFNIPKEEVTNNLYWRQLDASRNSVQMVGQANFSHKELQHKTCNMIQDMLMEQKGINWNDLPTYQKRGTCVIKGDETETITEDNIGTDGSIIGTKQTIRSKWIIDTEIPIFKGEGRQYIEKLINFE